MEYGKRIDVDSPFRLSGSLIATRYSHEAPREDTFTIQREIKPPGGLMDRIVISEGTLDYMVKLFPVIRVTFETTSVVESEELFAVFLTDIALQFDSSRVPTADEIRLWFAEKGRISPVGRANKLFNLEFELIVNFEDFVITELKKYLC